MPSEESDQPAHICIAKVPTVGQQGLHGCVN